MKALNILWKDLLLTLHDRAALLMILAAPLVLTLGLGAVTGSFSPNPSSGLQEIPVMVVNQDEGPLGEYVLEAFQSEELQDLLAAEGGADPASARKRVEDDSLAGAVLIPAGFSASLLPDERSGATGPAAPVEIYTNPSRPISASVVRSVAAGIIQRVEALPVSGQVAVDGLLASGRLAPQEISAYVDEMSSRLAAGETSREWITVQVNPGAAPQPAGSNSFLAYLAPGMAVFFLMYTVTYGGRSLLAERDSGTLPRLLASPAGSAQVLGGKVLSIFITGLLQVGLLILAASLLFGLRWGDPLGVVLLLLAVSAAATGWGILLASVAATPFQVSSLGTALMLFFGLLGGTFIPTSSFSNAVRLLSKLTPNAWAMDGFQVLGSGGSLAEVLPPVAALLLMAAALFGLAIALSRRRWASGFMSR